MRKLAYILIGTTGFFLLVNLILRVTGVVVWDDAYFFVRYADNLLQDGSWSWNPGKSPSYGLTSLAYGAQVGVFRMGSGPPALTLWLGSMIWGTISLLALWRLMFTKTDPNGKSLRFAGFMAIVTIGFQIPQLTQHFTSGMDTMMGVAWITGYLLLFKRWESGLSPGKAFVLGLFGGLTWFVRPELMLLTVGLPLGAALWSEKKLLKTQGWYTLLFTWFFLISCAFLAQNYFGNVFPLSFWVKSANSYGPEITSQYHLEGLKQLGIFAACNWIPLGLIIWAMVIGRRNWWKKLSPGDRALTLVTLFYLVYETVFVLQIMGYSQRFYFPVWPALLYLGGRSLVILLEERPEMLSNGPIKVQWKGVMGLMVVFAMVISLSSWLQRPRNLSRDWGKFATEDIYKGIGEHNWPLLPRWDIFPKDFKLGGTELGIPGVMHSEKEIVDLTGLHDPNMIGGFSIESLLARKADILYMPHPDYTRMHQVLGASEAFQEAYHVYSPATLQSYLGIALWRKSPYYYQMKGIVEDYLEEIGTLKQ